MLTELLEHDHRQQARTSPATGDNMEGSRRLGDLLAIPAGELLPYGLDDLPLTGRRLQSLGHVLAELAQPVAATAAANLRGLNHHAFTRQMLGEGVALAGLARETGDGRSLRNSALRR